MPTMPRVYAADARKLLQFVIFTNSIATIPRGASEDAEESRRIRFFTSPVYKPKSPPPSELSQNSPVY